MHEDRIDLSALDPAMDPAYEQRLAAISRDAMDARLSTTDPDLLRDVANWWRPALIAAGLIILLAVPALRRLGAPEGSVTAPHTVVGSLGIPASLNDLLHSNRVPSVVELSAAMAGGR